MGDGKKTVFITGVSSGLGKAIAQAALEAGHTVVGTVRSYPDAEAFERLNPGRAVARLLDVTNDDDVKTVIDEVETETQGIDVLIASAGYGFEGVFEESSLADLRAQFDVNVFGAAATIHAVIPHMRRRRTGHILGVTSMGGLMTVPGLSFYCASKYALEGLLETIGKEVAEFGIHVTAVAPGSFRTDWAGRSMVRAERSIADYDKLFDPIRKARQEASGNQLGNPDLAGLAILKVLDSENPPAHLLLGSDALRLVRAGRAAMDAQVDEWDDLSRSTDYPDGAQIR